MMGTGVLGLCPADADPTPATVEGTRAVVERFYALKRMEDGGGGAAWRTGSTTLLSPGPKKTKSPHAKKTKTNSPTLKIVC